MRSWAERGTADEDDEAEIVAGKVGAAAGSDTGEAVVDGESERAEAGASERGAASAESTTSVMG